MDSGATNFLANAAYVLIPMILSLTVHEYAHAAAAKLLGDDTAKMEGRLTLNPIVHIDPIGTLLLPILLLLFGGGSFFFGWAKPVPFNPTRFTRKVTMRTGTMIVAAAGPASNLVVAFFAFMIFSALAYRGLLPEGAGRELLGRMATINVALCIFNLIPVYPLDGQKVLTGLLPTSTAIAFERFSARYGSWLLLAVIAFGGKIIAVPYQWVIRGLAALFNLNLG